MHAVVHLVQKPIKFSLQARVGPTSVLTIVYDHRRFLTLLVLNMTRRQFTEAMETIAIAKFKATYLAVLERVRKTGRPILSTKRGIPITQVYPPPAPELDEQSAFGCMAGTAKELKDIVVPLSEDEWEVMR